MEELISLLRNLSDINVWKSKRVDLAFWHEVLNILDEILEDLLNEHEKSKSENEMSQVAVD